MPVAKKVRKRDPIVVRRQFVSWMYRNQLANRKACRLAKYMTGRIWCLPPAEPGERHPQRAAAPPPQCALLGLSGRTAGWLAAVVRKESPSASDVRRITPIDES